MKNFFYQLMIATLVLAVPSVQAHAVVRATDVELAVAMGNVEHLLNSIHLDDAAIQQEESELQADLAETSAVTSQRAGKILKRLERKLPRADRTIDKEVAKLNDAQVAAELNRVGVTAGENSREQLREVYQQTVRGSLPQLANQIADAGGMIPYLVKAKKSLNSQDSVASGMGKAGAAVLLGTIVLVTVLGLLVGWVVVLSVYFTLGLVAVIYISLNGTD